MKRREVLRRLCELQAQVHERVVGYDEAADCFCKEGGFWSESRYSRNEDEYRNDGGAVAYIEAAVQRCLEEKWRPTPSTEGAI